MSDDEKNKAAGGPVGIPMGEFKVGVVVPIEGQRQERDEIHLDELVINIKPPMTTMRLWTSQDTEEHLALEKKLADAEACLADIRKALRDDGETPDDELVMLAAVVTTGLENMMELNQTLRDLVRLLSDRVTELEARLAAPEQRTEASSSWVVEPKKENDK